MIKQMDDVGENVHTPKGDLASRLRTVVREPLQNWREVYESFSPVDLETGERRPRIPEPDEDWRRAAVLVPILLTPEGARIVYTLRKGDLPDHAGQISFPGGVPEPQDRSLLETALREAEEIFSVSLEELMFPGSFKKVVWRRDGRRCRVPVFAVAGYEIWGATAAMTAGLLARLGWKEHAG